MARPGVVAKAEPLLEGALARLSIEIVDIEYRKENRGWVFRVYIDHEDGVDHNRCQEASDVISDILDNHGLIEHAYTLEVSSPGLDRIIKKDRDFVKFSGRKVKIKAHEAINGQKNFTGILKGIQGDDIVIDIDGKTVSIPRSNAKQVRLVVEL
ncbi:MAG: ribosome maturation factor RimP [Syntrophomonadaceae bacterium]|nr:ribosome maturation factor RimP [Syntrophomonadaceae bacterium]